MTVRNTRYCLRKVVKWGELALQIVLNYLMKICPVCPSEYPLTFQIIYVY